MGFSKLIGKSRNPRWQIEDGCHIEILEMKYGMFVNGISKLTYNVRSCARQQNTPGVSFCILFDPRDLKTKTSCHPKVTIVIAAGDGRGEGKGPALIFLSLLSSYETFYFIIIFFILLDFAFKIKTINRT